MITIERCDPQRERTCGDCRESDVCPHLGTSPLVFGDGGEVKCIVIDQGDATESLLIPIEIEIAPNGKVVGYRVAVKRFRQGKLWRWLRRTFA